MSHCLLRLLVAFCWSATMTIMKLTTTETMTFKHQIGGFVTFFLSNLLDNGKRWQKFETKASTNARLAGST